jgi:hypothetical protein
MMDEMKKKNPLFVVMNDGQDVEEVDGPWAYMVQKLGLRPYITFLNEMFEYLASQVGNFGSFRVLKDWVDGLVESLENALKKGEGLLRPLLSTWFPQS